MPTAEKLPSVKTPVPEAPAEVASPEERVELVEQWLELARVSQRTAIETVGRFLEMAESVPLVGTGLSITERLAHAEYDVLRSIAHGAVGVDVNVGVNVDVLKGVHVDVLRRGVNVNVLSREARP